MKQLKNNKGLSLVELILWIIIIAVVAAIGVPQIKKGIEKSREKKDIEMVREIMDVVVLYSGQQENAGDFTISLTASGEAATEGSDTASGFELKSSKWGTVTLTYSPQAQTWTITQEVEKASKGAPYYNIAEEVGKTD